LVRDIALGASSTRLLKGGSTSVSLLSGTCVMTACHTLGDTVNAVGGADAAFATVSDAADAEVCATVGRFVGDGVGRTEGLSVGAAVGIAVGFTVSNGWLPNIVGPTVGMLLGSVLAGGTTR